MEFNYYEVECAVYGSEWEAVHDSGASGDEYLTAKEGLNSTDSVRTSDESTINLDINVSSDGTYYLFARLNCQNANDDSFYMKIDDADFATYNNMQTQGWQWIKLSKTDLTSGSHTLTFSYREDGAKIDKICITDHVNGPTDDLDISFGAK